MTYLHQLQHLCETWLWVKLAVSLRSGILTDEYQQLGFILEPKRQLKPKKTKQNKTKKKTTSSQ